MKAGKWTFQIFKLAVSAGLILFLLRRISPGRLAVDLRNADPLMLAAALAIFFTSSLLGAVQWHVLLRAGEVNLPFGRTFRLYFTGLFFNNFLPANIGGDAFKIYDVVRGGNEPHRVFAITLLDRVFGITGLCVLALAASIIIAPSGIIEGTGVYIAVFLVLVIPVFLLAFSRNLSGRLRSVTGKIRLWGLGERIELVLNHIGRYRSLRALTGGVILLTLVIQSMRILTHIAVGKALGIELGGWTLTSFFVFVPLLGLVMTLPISINGLGVREGAGIVLFSQVGIFEEQALLMEFITYVVQVVISLTGGVFFLLRGGDRRKGG